MHELPWLDLPDGFTLGTGTSAYQIEGAPEADGKGPSIWDTFCRRPGAVVGGDHGDVACDHYARWEQDLDLLKGLGIPAYRFSISWPRVQPTGTETEAAAGLDYYDRLVDGLLARGITPWVTLYHWDLPQALQDGGGWASRDIVGQFERFTELVHRRLGDRVNDYITLNEPWVFGFLGYGSGEHAPGRKHWPEFLAASHHALLAHSAAMDVLADAHAGITLNLVPQYPASYRQVDVDFARWNDGFFNRWYLDALTGRGYPEDMVADYRAAGHLPTSALPFVQPGDMERIVDKGRFLGINYYSRAVSRPGDVPAADNRILPVPPPALVTDMDWEVSPDALRDLLLRLHQHYGFQELVITENGAAYDTAPEQGRVRDVQRTAYLAEHLRACHQAIAGGAPLSGYFVWSLLDNFEWALGYAKRFGIVWVDFETQERVIKDSARFYAEVCRRHAVPV